MGYVIGVDEAGRGPLAGPVFVGAVLVPTNLSWKDFPNLRDSKKLTALQRDKWFEEIKTSDVLISTVSFSSSGVIDKKGIVAAANAAATRAVLNSLNQTNRYYKVEPCIKILCDAGLCINERPRRSFIWWQKQIVKGDELVPAIALASIVAKVSRDRYMTQLAKTYPGYGFEKHKGYGTAEHRSAILRHGVCKIHRQTFLKNLL